MRGLLSSAALMLAAMVASAAGAQTPPDNSHVPLIPFETEPFIKLKPGAKPFTLDELRAQLAGKLGKHEMPAAVEFVDDLPRTPVGKLSRHELRQQQKPSHLTQPGGRS